MRGTAPSLLHPTHPRYGLEQGGKGPAQTSPCGPLPRLTQTLLLHQLQPHPDGLQELTNIHPTLEAEVAVGWQPPILYRQHISPTYSQLQENTSLKTVKTKADPPSERSRMLLSHSLCPQPSTDRGRKGWQFPLCWAQPPMDNVTLRVTCPEPPPCQRCHHVPHHRSAPAQPRRQCWPHLYLWRPA